MHIYYVCGGPFFCVCPTRPSFNHTMPDMGAGMADNMASCMSFEGL